MTNKDYRIVPYSEALNQPLLLFEKGIVQGGSIKLEIVKDHFLSRAIVFTNFQALLATDPQQHIAGTAIGAQTTIEVNGNCMQAGFGFDAKIALNRRKMGLGTKLAQQMHGQFFEPNGLTKNYMTAKSSNIPVLKMISRAFSATWIYDFTYLTIPASARMRNAPISRQNHPKFGVRLFDQQDVPGTYYTLFESGLGHFHSFKMYRVKISSVAPAYKFGLRLLKKCFRAKYGKLPGEGDTISFSVLYNHAPHNLEGINEVLHDLQKRGISHLLVCCKKGDAIFHSLKSIAVNSYDYCLVSDFNLTNNDCVNIDARCL
ncbi:MAG: hypothetical protein BGO21_02910 [Dyadobacter sp. 50-39]|uniref:hypothetical protein n=1 Tax=Dyadobacter sp. 50-39 TaxID=1895756 RepID=UPI000969D29E|nr:hypothetical protein [Dyadobacter sp. 50-39]OJV12711.1 MAG: hypothetical protein BGO21_02910 [Dyadobacter sp. 50-39]